MGDQDFDLSPKELQQLAMILNCLKEGPLTNAMVDIPRFAKKAGLAAGSAKNVLIRIRKKLDDGETADLDAEKNSPSAEGKTKKAPAKENPEKRKESPEKKLRAPRKKKAKVESSGEEAEEEAA